MKRFFSLFLALTLVLALSVPAFAADYSYSYKDGKITGYLTAEAMGDEKIDCEDINTEKADEISFSFFTAQAGMNIDMYFTLDGEDAAKGAMMGQFPVEAKRK